MSVDIARRVQAPITDAMIRQVIAATLRVVAASFSSPSARRDRDFSVAFVGPRQMRIINRKHRNVDDVTDVLAFEGADEILICPTVARANAKRAGESWRRELVRLLVHGTLHCCGYDHATPAEAEAMFSIQEAVVAGRRPRPPNGRPRRAATTT